MECTHGATPQLEGFMARVAACTSKLESWHSVIRAIMLRIRAVIVVRNRGFWLEAHRESIQFNVFSVGL